MFVSRLETVHCLVASHRAPFWVPYEFLYTLLPLIVNKFNFAYNFFADDIQLYPSIKPSMALSYEGLCYH